MLDTRFSKHSALQTTQFQPIAKRIPLNLGVPTPNFWVPPQY